MTWETVKFASEAVKDGWIWELVLKRMPSADHEPQVMVVKGAGKAEPNQVTITADVMEMLAPKQALEAVG